MLKKLLAILVSSSVMSLALAASIEGQWVTIDDKSHQPKALVQIKKIGKTYIGKVIKLFPAATATICTKCIGSNKNKPVVGMVIMTGLKDVSNNKFEQGRLFDPESGHTYSGSAELLQGGNRLKLRGYIGIKWLGRSQIWRRETASQ